MILTDQTLTRCRKTSKNISQEYVCRCSFIVAPTCLLMSRCLSVLDFCCRVCVCAVCRSLVIACPSVCLCLSLLLSCVSVVQQKHVCCCSFLLLASVLVSVSGLSVSLWLLLSVCLSLSVWVGRPRPPPPHLPLTPLRERRGVVPRSGTTPSFT